MRKREKGRGKKLEQGRRMAMAGPADQRVLSNLQPVEVAGRCTVQQCVCVVESRRDDAVTDRLGDVECQQWSDMTQRTCVIAATDSDDLSSDVLVSYLI